MRSTIRFAAALLIGCGLTGLAVAEPPPEAAPVFVPYADLAAVVGPDDRAVLMDRAGFAKLLADAAARPAEPPRVASIAEASYAATVSAGRLDIRGELLIDLAGDLPTAVPLRFGGLGLTSVLLDGKPAPLGHDDRGRLAAVLAGKPHRRALTVAGSAELTDIQRGGSQFSLALPAAVAGRFTLTVPGDVDVHASAPQVDRDYDAAADATTVQLALGGLDALSVVLTGNGRAEAARPILLGESVASVRLTPAGQTLECLYTVSALRRGVRELTFTLPAGWTVTDLASPDLVRWDVSPAGDDGLERISVRLRSATVGAKPFRLAASAPMPPAPAAGGEAERQQASIPWAAPRLLLIDADHQRGLLAVDPGEQLNVRGPLRLVHAQRAARAGSSTSPATGLIGGILLHHWGDDWSASLALAPRELERRAETRQAVVVSADLVRIQADFIVRAVGREMFEVAFDLPPAAAGWEIARLAVYGVEGGFEQRTADSTAGRVLTVALAKPVTPSGGCRVEIAMQRAGPSTGPADLSVPLVHVHADSVRGLVYAVADSTSDLDLRALAAAPAPLEAVTVGRMAGLGLGSNVQLAWTYEGRPADAISLSAVARTPRLTAQAVGLVGVQPGVRLVGRWRLDYMVSRARTSDLYLLADRQLDYFSIDPFIQSSVEPQPYTQVRWTTVAPGADGAPSLTPEQAKRYNLWRVTFDAPVAGHVPLRIEYGHSAGDVASVAAPLVRPIGVEQAGEFLAVASAEELAVAVRPTAATTIDAIELPPLPASARRLIAALRLEPTAAVELDVQAHANYAIPAAVVNSLTLTTVLGRDGRQQTRADLVLVNAGLQFLPLKLAAGAELWSAWVGGELAKPRRDAEGNVLLALPRGRRDLAVQVVYCTPSAEAAGRLALASLAVASKQVLVNEVRWTVFAPPGMRVSGWDTELSPEGGREPKRAIDQIVATGGEVVSGPLLGDAYYRRMPPSPAAVYDANLRPLDGSLESDTEFDSAESNGQEGTTGIQALTARAPAGQTPPAGAERQSAARPILPAARAEGRYTLPVELTIPPGAVPASFAGIGSAGAAPKLAVELSDDSTDEGWFWLGFAAVALIGVLTARSRLRAKFRWVLFLLAVSAGVQIWWTPAAGAAGGAFVAALLLTPFYLLAAAGLWLVRTLPFSRGDMRRAAATGTVLLLTFVLTGQASAEPAAEAAGRAAQVRPGPVANEGPVIPYAGDPTQADRADKVLVPYARFVELWNRAHPDQRIDAPADGAAVAVADARYTAELAAPQMKITLTARLVVHGGGRLVLPMPFAGLAVTAATLDDKPADENFQAGPKGTVLLLEGPGAGAPPAEHALRIDALATPKASGRTGRLDLSLPPLPAAVMAVRLGDDEQVLTAEGAEGAVSRSPEGDAWLVPLGAGRDLSLRWSPKAGGGAADRTLAARADHDVHFFHWAAVAVSRFRFSFSGGQYDRFSLLVPAEAKVTELDGPNVRDFAAAGKRQIDGHEFVVLAVRMSRPAERGADVTVRWLAPLPAMGKPARLWLPRADEVGRESGEAVLNVAGGLGLRVVEVVGARRSDRVAAPAGAPAAGAAPEATVPAGRFAFPYRPFSITVELSREQANPRVRVNQLVRVRRDGAELAADATMIATAGRLFAAAFVLPAGYELEDVTGADVWEWYRQDAAGRPLVRVAFRAPVASTRVVLTLRRDGRPDAAAPFAVPTVTAVDDAGEPLADQSGRLAVQVEGALEATTVRADGLRSIRPNVLTDWLEGPQASAVQFACEYDRPGAALELAVRAKPTRTRVQLVTAVGVHATAALFTWRLRYTIEGFPVDHVSFSLPAELARRAAVAPRPGVIRSVRQASPADGRIRYDVALVHEVTGVLDVAVNLALPIDATTRRLEIPELTTDAPDGYHAIVVVQNASRHELTAADAAGLTEMPPSAQATALGDLAGELRSSLQFVYQGFAPGWRAAMAVRPAEPARRVEAVVDLLATTTVVARDGQCRYRVEALLQNRSEQFLRVRVPAALRLVGATAAGEAVKPAIDPTAGDVVLVPLVKTEAGGLPYTVVLHLAGRAVEPLGDGRTAVAPPPIDVLDVPVDRTTWSLRLPEGFHYFRPERFGGDGGNMNPIAADIEERILRLGAKMRQLRRYAESGSDMFSFSSSYEYSEGSRPYEGNWEKMNEDINREREALRRDISARGRLGDKEREKFAQQLEESANTQYRVLGQWQQQAAEQQQRAALDVNNAFNRKADNAGLAERDRNKALDAQVGFLSVASKEQALGLRSELDRQNRGDNMRYALPQGQAESLLAGEGKDEKDAELARLAAGLDRDAITHANRMQARRQNQSHMDSRHELNFLNAPNAEPGPVGEDAWGHTSTLGASTGGRFFGTASAAPDSGRGSGAAVVVDGAAQINVNTATADSPHYLAGTTPAAAAVAGGTFSLPVELPEGGVKMDFTRPGGGARLVVWAVPEQTVSRWTDTLIALAALALVLLLAAMVRRAHARRGRTAAAKIIAYLLLLALLTLAGGLILALPVWVLCVGIVELIVRLARDRSAA